MLIPLSTLRTDVGLAIDATVSSGRYPDAVVDRFINQAIGAYYVLLWERGHARSIRASVTVGASPTPALMGWGANELVALPADLENLVSVSRVDGTRRFELEPRQIADVDSAVTDRGPGTPRLYDVIVSPTGQHLLLSPPSNSTYQLEVEYRAAVAPLTSPSQSVFAFAGTEDLIIAKAGMGLLGRDRLDEPEVYQVLERRYGDAMARLDVIPAKVGVRAMRDTSDVRRARRYGARDWPFFR